MSGVFITLAYCLRSKCEKKLYFDTVSQRSSSALAECKFDGTGWKTFYRVRGVFITYELSFTFSAISAHVEFNFYNPC